MNKGWLTGAVLAGWLIGPVQAIAATLPTLHFTDNTGKDVPDAVVELKDATAVTPPQTPDEVIVDQINIAFVPEIAVIRVGTKVRFPNSDETRHHVYSFSEAKPFELQLYKGNDAPPIEFDKAGLVALGCNIHDSMRGYIYVVEGSLFGQTDDQGAVTLPAFNAEQSPYLVIWHPDMETPFQLAIADLADPNADRLDIQLPFELTVDDPSQSPSSLYDRLQRYQSDGN
ncbi:methylamine utilization protein [Saccharospirillum mangrovi]|uniref:methylamine utilization protein n=1 Tax=Saccharospirillum mangrovi TaxID=2161747 RepID=UPI00130043D4|nr:methylamine utilization protein [Saccharospirillum mangrovi]